MEDKVTCTEKLTVTKYKNEQDRKDNKPYEVVEEVCEKGNCALNAGMTLMWQIIAGLSVATYASDNAELGIGSDNTAADPTQTDLLADGTWKAMEADYPSVTNQTITFRAEFGINDANFHWWEYGVRNANNVLMNRIVSDKGTKLVGEVWLAELSITLS